MDQENSTKPILDYFCPGCMSNSVRNGIIWVGLSVPQGEVTIRAVPVFFRVFISSICAGIAPLISTCSGKAKTLMPKNSNKARRFLFTNFLAASLRLHLNFPIGKYNVVFNLFGSLFRFWVALGTVLDYLTLDSNII